MDMIVKELLNPIAASQCDMTCVDPRAYKGGLIFLGIGDLGQCQRP